MRKLNSLKLLLCAALMCIGANAWSVTQVIYSTGFESSEGFAASTTYNNSSIAYFGPSTQQWGTIYGCATTNASTADLQGMQMRIYKNQTSPNPYVFTNFSVAQTGFSITKIQFKAKTDSKAVFKGLKLQISTDGGSSWTDAVTHTFSGTTAETVTYTPSTAITDTDVRIRIYVHNFTADKSNTKKCTIDEVEVTGESAGAVALSVPSNLSETNIESTSATLTWDAVAHASSYTVKIGDTEYSDINTNSYDATGLSASTQYTWTVKAIGDGTNYTSSAYASDKQFTTTKTLSSLAITGTPTKLSYEEGETFNRAGLTVTATYNDASTADVTSSVNWTVTPAYLSVSTTQVTVMATLEGINSPIQQYNVTVAPYFGVVYSWDGTGSTKAATQTGGVASVPITSSSNMVAGSSQSGHWCFKMNKGVTASGGPFVILITLDKALKTGDIISGAVFRASDSDATLGIDFLAASATASAAYTLANPQVVASGTPTDNIEFVVPQSANGCTTIRLYRNSGGTGLYVSKFVVTRPVGKVTVSTAQYATYYNASQAFTMPEGLEGLTVSAANGTALTTAVSYSAGDVVPADEPIILHATSTLAENTSFTLYAGTTSASQIAANKLHGTTTGTTTGATGSQKYYRLANGSNGVGFYYGAADGAAFSIAADKAYLIAGNGALGAPAFFSLTDEATAVENVEAGAEAVKFFENGQLFIKKNGVVYTVMGQIVK